MGTCDQNSLMGVLGQCLCGVGGGGDWHGGGGGICEPGLLIRRCAGGFERKGLVLGTGVEGQVTFFFPFSVITVWASDI